MNILIVGGTPAHRGGVEQFCNRACEALSEIGGHRVEHIYSHGAYLRPQSLPAFIGSILGLVVKRGRRCDCVWLQYASFPDLVFLLMSRLLGFTVLVTPHLGSNWTSQTNVAMRWLTKKLLAASSGIGLLSATQAEELALPASPPRFELFTFLPRELPRRPATRPDSHRLRLVHAGRLSTGKGSFLFLDVCAILHRAGLTFEASLIGSCDATTRSKLRSEIERAGLETSLDLMGPLPEAELLEQLTAADILVHLSQIDSFPLIVLESIGCGVFPVCKDLPGARLITKSYCGHIIYGSDEAEQTAQFIIKADPERLRTSARTASVQLKEDFGWSNCVDAAERAIVQFAVRNSEARSRRMSRLGLR